MYHLDQLWSISTYRTSMHQVPRSSSMHQVPGHIVDLVWWWWIITDKNKDEDKDEGKGGGKDKYKDSG